MSEAQPLTLQVTEARALNPLIRLLRLRRPDGGPLPPFSPGAHVRVRVRLDGGEGWRSYSLVCLKPEPRCFEAPDEYTIAVRREEPGRGGSRFMHDRVAVGDALPVLPPRNDFPLREHAGAAVLVAGGIGVTPLTAMASACVARGRPVRMHYAGRRLALMAFVEELEHLLGAALTLHLDDERGAPLDADALVRTCSPQDVLYVCGPAPMLAAVRAAVERAGWPADRLQFELFQEPVAQPQDQTFEVHLARSGRVLQVPADRSLLQVLEEAGCDVLSDCRRGECGVCRVDVVEGQIDHRDRVLSDAERASGKVMQICVSRARGPYLVLDL